MVLAGYLGRHIDKDHVFKTLAQIRQLLMITDEMFYLT